MRSLYFILAILISFSSCNSRSDKTNVDDNKLKLSIQSYTFNRFTLVDAINKAHDLGIQYMEVYPKQKLGGEYGDVMFDYNLSSEHRNGIKEYAESKDVKLVATGVLVPQRNEWENVFSFASEMGMDYISAEPNREDWDLVESLSERYKIKVATHNHPSEKSYWQPEELLKYIESRSALLGSNCDIGHFKRMGLDPLESVKKLEGRLISLHFKDLAPKENGYEDVVWGLGVLDLENILKELKRQKYNGYITIEYEAEWDDNVSSIEKSIDYFNQLVSEIY